MKKELEEASFLRAMVEVTWVFLFYKKHRYQRCNFCIDGKRTSLIQTPCGISRSICTQGKGAISTMSSKLWRIFQHAILAVEEVAFFYNCTAHHEVNAFFSFLAWFHRSPPNNCNFPCQNWNSFRLSKKCSRQISCQFINYKCYTQIGKMLSVYQSGIHLGK